MKQLIPIPIVNRSELAIKSLKNLRLRAEKVWDYTPDLAIAANLTNPTSRILEDELTEMEHAAHTISVQTGQAAISTVLLTFLKPGDKVLIPDNVYGPVKLFAENQLNVFNIKSEYYDPLDLKDLKSRLDRDVRVVYLEAPGSMTFEVPDIGIIAGIAKEHSILTVMDNTYATPLYCKPLDIGIDVSLSSLSKLISGHSDVYGGSISVINPEFYKRLKNMAVFMGHWLAPENAERIHRGLQTLPIRLEKQFETSQKLISFLQEWQCVQEIFAPYRPDTPYFKNWNKYFSGACGLFSFSFDDSINEEKLDAFFSELENFHISYGWGGNNALIVPGSASRKLSEMPKKLIRVYPGLQNPNILIEDLARAFRQIT